MTKSSKKSESSKRSKSPSKPKASRESEPVVSPSDNDDNATLIAACARVADDYDHLLQAGQKHAQ